MATMPKVAKLVVDQLSDVDVDKIQSGKFTTVTLDKVSPELAKDFLRFNTHNRVKKPGRIAGLKDDIVNGRWKLVHQGIAFSKESVLIDGQNRLCAIRCADKTVPIQVTFNAAMVTQKNVDEVSPRIPFDTLKLNKYTFVDSKLIAGVVNKFNAYVGGHKIKYPQDDLLWLAGEIQDGVIEVMDRIKQYGNAKIIRRAAVIVPMVRGYYSRKISRDRLWQFIEAMSTGIVENKVRDGAVIRMRDFLVQITAREKKARAAADQLSIYGKTERTLLLFSKGEIGKQLSSSKAELFPVQTDVKLNVISNRLKKNKEQVIRQLKEMDVEDAAG